MCSHLLAPIRISHSTKTIFHRIDDMMITWTIFEIPNVWCLRLVHVSRHHIFPVRNLCICIAAYFQNLHKKILPTFTQTHILVIFHFNTSQYLQPCVYIMYPKFSRLRRTFHTNAIHAPFLVQLAWQMHTIKISPEHNKCKNIHRSIERENFFSSVVSCFPYRKHRRAYSSLSRLLHCTEINLKIPKMLRNIIIGLLITQLCE